MNEEKPVSFMMIFTDTNHLILPAEAVIVNSRDASARITKFPRLYYILNF